MEEIEDTFREVPDVRVVHRQGSVEIEIGSNTIARIKKMRADGFTSNYLTPRAKAFHGSELQGELFSLVWAQPMRLDIGYIEDETGTHVAEVKVARRSSPSRVAWTYPMTESAEVTPMSIPETEEAASAPAEGTRVVARKGDTDAAAQGTDDE